MKVLQISVGARGRMWLRVLRELGADVVACVDPSPEAIAWVRGEYPGVCIYARVGDALSVHADVSLAVVVTPPMERVDVVLPLLAAGLHVISEKPLETKFARAALIVQAAEAAGRQLSVCLNFRFLPVTRALKDQMDGRWGQATSATFLYHINRDGRRPGINRFPLEMVDPMLLEQSIHHLDLLRFAYDAEITRVRAMTFNPNGSMYRGDATVAALLEMTRGISVTYVGSWVTGSNIRSFAWRTDCEHGVVIQRQLFDDLVAGPTHGPLQAIPVAAVEPFLTDTRLYAQAVLEALEAGAPVPCSGRDHLRSLAAALACRESSLSGRAFRPEELQ
ncbi:MAG: Gfo/Idh/MocA family protein [Armatimonadota bacterium]